MGTTTRLAIIQRTAKANKLYASGTATASGSTSLDDLFDTTRRKERDDHWNGSQFLFTASTTPNAGLLVDVSDFIQATSRLRFHQTLSSQSATADTYSLFRPPFTVADYRDACEGALDEAYVDGWARRGWDDTLYTALVDRYSLPSTLEDIAEVLVSPPSLLPDPDWGGGGSGWTLSSDAAIGNTGDSAARSLDHTATAANNFTTVDIGVQPLEAYSARVRASSSSGSVAVARYQFLDSGGALIGSATTLGTHSSTAASGLISGSFIAPVNAFQVRFGLGSSSTGGTVSFWEHHLNRQDLLTALPRASWRLEWEGTTGRLHLKDHPGANRVLRLRGRRALESLSNDSDTVSFDTPEVLAFVYLTSALLWEHSMGQIPDVDGSQAEAQSAKFRGLYRRALRGSWNAWAPRVSVRRPRWG